MVSFFYISVFAFRKMLCLSVFLFLSYITLFGQSGVTVITHGFNGYGSNWFDMAKAIKSKKGEKAVIYKNDISTGRWVAKDINNQPINNPVMDNQTEIILIYDWATYSRYLTDGCLEGAADNLFALLAAPIGISGYSGNLITSNLHKHFIGHSRGCILLLQLLHRIGYSYKDVKIEHLTTLDPHPAKPMRDILLPGVRIVNENMDKYEMQIPFNVLKADNYFRQDGDYEIGSTFSTSIAFDGIPSPNSSNNIELIDGNLKQTGYGNAHSNVHAWYFGKMNLPNQLYDGFNIPNDILPCWYSWQNESPLCSSFGLWSLGRSTYGYNDSRIGGDYNDLGTIAENSKISIESMNEQLARKQGIVLPFVPITRIPPEAVFNGDFKYGTIGWDATGGKLIYGQLSNGGAKLDDTVRHSYMLFQEKNQYGKSHEYLCFSAKGKLSNTTVTANLKIVFYDIQGNEYPYK